MTWDGYFILLVLVAANTIVVKAIQSVLNEEELSLFKLGDADLTSVEALGNFKT